MSDTPELTDLADMVRARAKERGDAIAYEFEGRQTSFAEFDIKTNQVANALIAAGVKHGDRICLSRQEQRPLFRDSCRRDEGRRGDDAGQLAAGADPKSSTSSTTARPPALFVGPEFIAAGPQALCVAAAACAPDHRDGRRRSRTGRPSRLARRAARRRPTGHDRAERHRRAALHLGHHRASERRDAVAHNMLNLTSPADARVPDWNSWNADDVSLVAMPMFHIAGAGWGMFGLFHGAKNVDHARLRSGRRARLHPEPSHQQVFLVPAALQFVVRASESAKRPTSRG